MEDNVGNLRISGKTDFYRNDIGHQDLGAKIRYAEGTEIMW
jgi:hypothetical protein